MEGADQDIMTQQQMIQLSKQARRHRSVPAGSMPTCLTASHVTGGCVSAVVYHADASTWRAQTGSAIGPSFQRHPSPPILLDASVGSVTRMPRRNARPERQFGRLVSNGEACLSLSLSLCRCHVARLCSLQQTTGCCSASRCQRCPTSISF